MSIFDRLYDIARANLNDAMPGRKIFSRESVSDPSEGERSWRRYKTDDQHRDSDPFNNQGPSEEPAGRHQDPVLAQYYANLEIPYGSDLVTAKKAWKRLMRNYHPDRHAADPEKRKIAEELTQNLNRAYSEIEKHLGGSS